MSNTATGESLTVQEAVDTLHEAAAFEQPLRRRSEGVTWMIWGVITACIQLSFDALGSSRVAWPYWAIVILWPLVGSAMTLATWRIAGVGAPSLEPKGKRSVLGSLAWLPVVYALWGVLALIGPGLQEAAF
ncbi:MAG: hypothetical protein R3185_08770, partial [Candidatus Thermoplasmatota archaeon]|nr:hypothetical protein [Candidatus Thermoplasmatota archaeon]